MKNIWRMLILLLVLILSATPSFGHCDSRNGPVVKAARAALETGDVNLVLIWVAPRDEAELKISFSKTLKVRSLNKNAKDLAEEFFFETAVRLHRLSEGLPYTGLKNEVFDPAIVLAEKAIERKSSDSLLHELNILLQQGLDKHLLAVLTSATYESRNLAAGREYVRHYTSFLHYVESVHKSAATQAATHHNDEAMIIPPSTSRQNNQTMQNRASLYDQLFILAMPALFIIVLLMIIVLAERRKSGSGKKYLFHHLPWPGRKMVPHG
jgi:hypothetical protein